MVDAERRIADSIHPCQCCKDIGRIIRGNTGFGHEKDIVRPVIEGGLLREVNSVYIRCNDVDMLCDGLPNVKNLRVSGSTGPISCPDLPRINKGHIDVIGNGVLCLPGLGYSVDVTRDSPGTEHLRRHISKNL